MDSPRSTYSALLEGHRSRLLALDRLSGRFANLRTVSFLSALGLAGATVFGKLPSYGWLLSLAALGAYALLASRHGRVIADEQRTRVLISLNERGLARLDGRWRNFPERGDRYLKPAHLNAPDLDLFGQGSLFQLLDETATAEGELRLASGLLEPGPLEELPDRQAALRELAPRVKFRQLLVAEARLAAEGGKADLAPFLRWVEEGPSVAALRWCRPLPFILPPLTLALFVLGDTGYLARWLYWVPLLAQIGLVLYTSKRLKAFFEAISMGERGVVRFEGTFRAIEAERFENPLLSRLRAGLEVAGPTVSERLHAFGRLYAFAELRRSTQLHPVFNALVLWDLHWMLRLEVWRAREGAHVRGWFTALAELEALSAMATLGHDRPDYSWPRFVAGAPRLEATELGHPLLDAPVRNDVTLDAATRGLIITGSNMSGKTTLLRTLGINAVMALAGLPVCARSLTLSRLQVVTSMRVKDSLERGVSYFYAEVQRIKAVLDAARSAGGQALFLLDELLMGTNARERQVASQALVLLLLATGAVGAITTHDLSLTELAAIHGELRNIHFRDTLDQGAMSFDYKIRTGVVQTTNALRLLEAAGIPLTDSSKHSASEV